jgi:MraZ protein
MFLGSYEIKLDDKGRLLLPAKSRDVLENGTYITRGQDRCLFLFSNSQFKHYKEQIKEYAPPNIPAMAFDRVLFSSVINQNLDKQGRITVSQALREYAELKRNIAVVGLENRIEIWDSDNWNKYLKLYEDGFSGLKDGIR